MAASSRAAATRSCCRRALCTRGSRSCSSAPPARCSRKHPVRLASVDGNRQRLDGGAMYGNAPRAVWERWTAPDAENRIELACRCLLVEDLDGKTVLFETGIGVFFEPKLRARYGVQEDEHVLLRSLAARGVSRSEEHTSELQSLRHLVCR